MLTAALSVSAGAIALTTPAVPTFSRVVSTAPRSLPPTMLKDEDMAKLQPELTYSEASREFRRTVYFHENWVKHRSTDRFAKNILTTFDSGVIKSIGSEIGFVTGAAVAVVLANMALSGYTDLAGVQHAAPLANPLIKSFSLPAMPFTIGMPALSLLLVFRTNTAYFRWNEARTLWGGIVNTCRNIGRQGGHYFPTDEKGELLRDELVRHTAAFPKALRSFLRGADDDATFKAQMLELLGPEGAEAIMQSKNRQTFVTHLIGSTIQRADLHPMEKARMDESVSRLVDYLGACERIFRSPIPLVYTRHTSRFIGIFMALLPLGLWGPMADSWNHWATIPATAALATFLFGIEELGIQIEEPFGILPLEALCDGSIETVLMDMKASYDVGHFGNTKPTGSILWDGSDSPCGEATCEKDYEEEMPVVDGKVVPTEGEAEPKPSASGYSAPAAWFKSD